MRLQASLLVYETRTYILPGNGKEKFAALTERKDHHELARL